MKKEKGDISPKRDVPIITTKSTSDEIWEAHIRGELIDEEYKQALIGLVARRVRVMERQKSSNILRS